MDLNAQNDNSEFKVLIPEEKYDLLNFNSEGLPGVAVVNSTLRDFEPKEIFAWHLSLVVTYQSLIDNEMPSEEERTKSEQLEDFLHPLIKVNNTKPNALFLGRVTWHGTREIIWRVYDPELANKTLQRIIESGDYPIEFEYSMSHDDGWEQAEWYLQELK